MRLSKVAHLLYWYNSTCFAGTKVLALLVQKYLLTGTTVQILTPEELLHRAESNGHCFQGRAADKIFLYEVVSSKSTGLDMDRLDYLQRDVQATN